MNKYQLTTKMSKTIKKTSNHRLGPFQNVVLTKLQNQVPAKLQYWVPAIFKIRYF